MKIKTNFLWVLSIVLISIIACTPKVSEVSSKSKKLSETKVKIESNESLRSADGTSDEVSLLNNDIPVDPSYKTGILSNGMKYFIKKNGKPENRVELRLALNAGSIQEDDNQKGLAHFIEHMEFNGSEHFTGNQLINYLEKVGTKFGPDLNAYTSFDETVYMLQVRSDEPKQLDTGLLVIYDWAGKAAFDHKEIDKERGVVISEWRTRLSPGQRMMQKYLPIMYKGSRYAERLPIGDPEIVKHANYNTIKKFYKDWYRPDLMAVIVIGDVDVDQMEKKIKSMFSSFTNPQNERVREKYTVPVQKGTEIAIVTDKEAPFTNVNIINKLPHIKVKTKADLLKKIERKLFNMMLNARLDELKNSENPPFTYAYTGYNPSIGDIDSYTSWAMVPEGKALNAIETFVDENERVLRFGFLKAELDRQKINLLKSAERAQKEKDKTESRRYASKAVYHFLKNRPMMSENQYYNFLRLNIDRIKLNSINNLAKNWIKSDNRVVVVTGAEKVAVPMPTKNEIRKVLNEVKTKELKPYVDNSSTKPLFSKKLMPAPIKGSTVLSDFNISKLTLANGIEVYYKKTNFKNNEILFSAFSKGGYSIYEDKNFTDARFASEAVEEMGLSEFDNTQLEKLLTGKDVSASPRIGRLYETFRGSSTVDDLETMFQLINLYYTAPRKDKAAFNSYITRKKGIYSNLLKQPDYYFYYISRKIKYNDNPRAGGIPTADDFDKLNMDNIYQIYKDRFGDAGDFKFFFVGSFDESKLKNLIQKYLGNLPSFGKHEEWKDRNIDMRKGVIKKKLYNGEAPKTFVDVTYHGDFKWTPENNFVLKSLVKVMNIKLRESLREDKGGVYGVRVSGYGANEPKENYKIYFSFNAEPEKAEELLNAAYDVIQKLKTEGPDEEVMTKIKETQKQSRIKNLKENRFWLRQVSGAVQDNLNFSEMSIETLEKRIDNLTADNIKNAAIKYLNQDNNLIEILMYPDSYKK